MDASGTRPRARWQFGLHPAAAGSVIRTITRAELPVGDAMRIEMADSSGADLVHVQYHIATGSGGWALWISSPAHELSRAEERLPELVAQDEADAPA
jgi:hypothetical protein